MPPRVATRTVRLRQPRPTAHEKRMQLLIYPMALAQPGATVPLIQSSNDTIGSSNRRTLGEAQRPSTSSASLMRPGNGNVMESGFEGVGATADTVGHPQSHRHHSTLPMPRRWVRDADELCIAAIHRSNNINRINSYVATYKFDDPQWRPLLLPEVHVLPKAPMSHHTNKLVKDSGEYVDRVFSSSNPPPPRSPTSSTKDGSNGFDVFIDYNKMTTLELISRHTNYALRHLVQKGHAMYLVNFAQHSVVQMRGLVEASYVSCAYGIRGERLRTHIIHTGPVDVRDVLELDPLTQHVSFNFKKPHVRRGVVAVSTVEGYGTWFQRKPMLWQRTRRIGALQSQMGCYDYQLCDPAEVGRLRSYEVSLLAPHVRLIGAQGGAEAVALIASSQVAQNERLYMGQFEAPVLTAVDAVHQLAHRTALHYELLRPALDTEKKEVEEGKGSDTAGPETEKDRATMATTYEEPLLQEQRRLAGMERLLPVSWVTRTPPPYVPLESDLPFRIQMSRPAVFRTDQQTDKGTAAAAFPTGGTVGSPFVKGVPLSLFEYNVHQGVDHYIFDDAPSARPLKWWSQKSNMPYNGYLYAMRSGLLDYVEPAEKIANPLAPPSAGMAASGAETRGMVKSARRRRKRYSRARNSTDKQSKGRETKTETPAASVPSTASSASKVVREEDEEGHNGVTPMEINVAAEELPAGEDTLVGHDEESRQEAALQWVAEGNEVSVSDRPPLHALVAPNTAAQRRLRRYATHASTAVENTKDQKQQQQTTPVTDTARAQAMSLEDRADALLQRQLRLRRLRKQRNSIQQRKNGSETE